MKLKGFTLIELLVVVAILAILTAVTIGVFSNFQKSGRDARRKADIDAIAAAMEAHFNQTTGSGCAGGTAFRYCPLKAGYLASGQILVDPINSGVNIYCVQESDATQGAARACVTTDTKVADSKPSGGNMRYWMVCATLETNSGIGSVNYYCKQNLQ